MINRLCIIGVGLIGGSLARAARKFGLCQEIIGCGRHVAHLEQAKSLGVIDSYETDVAAAIKDADVIVIAVPLGAIRTILQAMVGHLPAGAVLTDVASAKQDVVAAATQIFGAVPAKLVPGHPIAGTEQSGVEASFAELFQRRCVILTPLAHTDTAALSVVRTLWEKVGAEVVEMTPRHHDEVLAATSHLPHILAYALVDSLVRRDESAEIFRFAAGGFRDFTRIASSDPHMWRDICLANRGPVTEVLAQFIEDLQGLKDEMEGGDGEQLLALFQRAKAARDRYCG